MLRRHRCVPSRKDQTAGNVSFRASTSGKTLLPTDLSCNLRSDIAEDQRILRHLSAFIFFAIRNLGRTFSVKQTLFAIVTDFEYSKGQFDRWKDGASIPDDRVRYTNSLCLVSAYPIVGPTLPNFGVTMALCLADR